ADEHGGGVAGPAAEAGAGGDAFAEGGVDGAGVADVVFEQGVGAEGEVVGEGPVDGGRLGGRIIRPFAAVRTGLRGCAPRAIEGRGVVVGSALEREVVAPVEGDHPARDGVIAGRRVGRADG